MIEQSAREFFADVRRRSARLEDLQRGLEDGPVQRHGSGPGSPGYKADPIGSLVVAALEQEAKTLEEIEACEEVVGAALVVVAGIRLWFSERMGQVIESRYIDRWEWERVAQLCEVDERTCRRDRDVALDWVDTQGLDWLRSGHAPRECGG